MQNPKQVTSSSIPLVTLACVIALGTNCFDVAASAQEPNTVKASALHKQALGYLQAGHFNEGIVLLNKAAREDSSDATIYFNLGVAYGKLNQHQKAWQAFRKSVALDPAKSDAWIQLGTSYALCGDKKQATNILLDVQRRFPNSLEAKKESNALLIKLAQGSTIGVTTAANVVRSDPTNLDAWLDLTNSYLAQNRTSEALATLEKASSRFANNKRYHYEAAFIFKKLKKYREAADQFMEAAKIDTTDPKLLDNVIWCQVRLGDFDGIQATRRIFVERFPNTKESKEMADAIKYYETDFANAKKIQASKQASTKQRGFNESDMPLKVFVHDRLKGRTVWNAKTTAGGDINYSLLLERALQEWSNASGKQITFMFSNRPDDANIECNWTSDRSQLDMAFASGVAVDTKNNKGQYKARIKLLAKAPGFDLTEPEFYYACLHELGHALGLSHSASPADIMYFSDIAASESSKLSTNDIARLKTLYSDLKTNTTSEPEE